jgi:hypothetical protein
MCCLRRLTLERCHKLLHVQLPTAIGISRPAHNSSNTIVAFETTLALLAFKQAAHRSRHSTTAGNRMYAVSLLLLNGMV